MKKQLFTLFILAVYYQTIFAQIQQNDTTICAGASITLTVDVPQSNGVTCTDDVFNPNLTYGSVTDIEGNTYKTIVIGTQEWMAENLRTATYNNGDLIPNVSDSTAWTAIWNNGSPTGQPAWCYYNNDISNNCPYGKLYNWYAATDIRGICPTGWHVPTDAEWNTLIGYLDPIFDPIAIVQSNIAGGKMKSTGTQYWQSPNTDATNSSGLSGLPGGIRSFNGGFPTFGYAAHWWSSTEDYTSYAWRRILEYNDGIVYRTNYRKPNGVSIRCIKD